MVLTSAAQRFLNQVANLHPLSHIGMQIHEIIQQAVWKQHAEEKTHYICFSPKLGILNEDREDDGSSHQKAIGWYSVEI